MFQYKNKLFDANELINIRLAPTCRQYINMSTVKIFGGVSHSFGLDSFQPGTNVGDWVSSSPHQLELVYMALMLQIFRKIQIKISSPGH